MLEVILRVAQEARMRGGRAAQVGDLVVETTATAWDWERVGYLVRHAPGGTWYLWTVGRRIVRWRNASVIPVPLGRGRHLNEFLRLSQEELIRAFAELDP
jgi:hypothetical protein